MRGRRALVVSSVAAAGVVVAALAAPAALASPSATGLASMNERVCATPALGSAACDAVLHVTGSPDGKGNGHKPGSGSSSPPPASYDASQLQAAYGLTAASSSDGADTTVAIVDAYDDPNAFADLGVYRSTEGLPPISQCAPAALAGATTPCFAKVDESGTQGSYPTPSTSWSEEISLDLDMISAICPNCNILLVEANSASFVDLGVAVDTAAGFRPAAIGNSYGGSEFGTESAYAAAYYDHTGIAVTVAAGDNGYGVDFPAAAASVIAVGGTSLRQATDGSWSQTVWSGTGSGCSAYIPKPTWQSDPGCPNNRTVADIAADADPNTGVDTYDTYGQSGWLVFGGTSVSAQIVAAVYGLAGGGVSNASSLYGNGSIGFGSTNQNLYDVTSGSDGSCTGHGRFADQSLAYLCTAGPGYDGPTGIGTPNGTLTGF